MSADQLAAVFQVPAAHLVPEYEVITLNHHGSQHNAGHHLHRRDISSSPQPPPPPSAPLSHHKKTDFSKSSYYSATKNQRLDDDRAANRVDLSALSEHNVSLSAFGTVYNLTLRPTHGLFRDGVQSLRMWTVKSEPNATNGLDYEPVEVSFRVDPSSSSSHEHHDDFMRSCAMLFARTTKDHYLLSICLRCGRKYAYFTTLLMLYDCSKKRERKKT